MSISLNTTNARRWTALFESGTTPWVMEDDHTYVCQIMGPMSADWARENAMLIAAAPDLLAACEAMANAPIRLDSSGFDDVDAERRAALKMIRAAIKKARDFPR